MKKIIIPFFILSISACNNNSEDQRVEELSCPIANPLYTKYHKINLEGPGAFPENLSIELEGELKYDECLESPVIPPAPPIVQIKRAENKLTIHVGHLDGYDDLPTETSLKVIDRGNCDAQNLFFDISNEPLNFEETYPNGDKCSSRVSAEISLTKNP